MKSRSGIGKTGNFQGGAIHTDILQGAIRPHLYCRYSGFHDEHRLPLA
jgi:hypothetical protein